MLHHIGYIVVECGQMQRCQLKVKQEKVAQTSGFQPFNMHGSPQIYASVKEPAVVNHSI